MDEGESKVLSVAHSLSGDGAIAAGVAATHAFAAAAALRPETAARLAIVVEELVMNLFEHGGVGPDQPVELTLTHRGGEVLLTIEDRGAFFDPAAVRPGAVPDRGGGAGIALVQAWSRVLHYAATGGINRLELIIADKGER